MNVNIFAYDELCPEDLRFISFIRTVKFGEVKVRIRNGKPVTIEEGIKTVKLED